MSARKILIIRFSSIGDILLTTPVVRCIKLQVPNSRIYFLTKETYAPLLQSNPYIDDIITLKHSLVNTVIRLKKIGFDCIIDLHKNQRTFFIRACFPTTPVISFDKINLKKWLFVRFKINWLPEKHLVDRYFEGIEKLGITNDYEGLDLHIPKQNIFDASLLPASFQRGFIVFSIGGNHETKKMPVQKWIELSRQITFPIAILGGEESAPAGEAIALARTDIVSLCGKTDILQSASVISHSNLVITHDTGLMHIAAAFKKPIISIWGNTVPQFGMYPYYGHHKVFHKSFEVTGLPCRPCSKLGYHRCPEGHFYCMTRQNISEIAAVVNGLMNRH